jgi:zinc transport system substrate-binding protein
MGGQLGCGDERVWMMMRRNLIVLGLVVNLLGLFCSTSLRAEEALQVAVSILPQKYFVEKIGGDAVNVSVMVDPGADPHTYDPKPQQMVALTRAKIYFAIGVPFEDAWLGKLAAGSPDMLIVHTDQWVEKLPITDQHHGGHSHSGHKHGVKDEHGTRDPHIWLSPPLVMIQARHIVAALSSVDPGRRPAFEENYRKFLNELVDLDRELMSMFFRKEGRKEFMVFHPSWGYFAEAYGLRQVSVEVEGKEPKAGDLKRLIEHARKEGIKIIFVQPQFSTTSARVVADAIGGEILQADPLAGNWAENLREMGKRFSEALSSKSDADAGEKAKGSTSHPNS